MEEQIQTRWQELNITEGQLRTRRHPSKQEANLKTRVLLQTPLGPMFKVNRSSICLSDSSRNGTEQEQKPSKQVKYPEQLVWEGPNTMEEPRTRK